MDRDDPTASASREALEAATRRAEQAEKALEAIYSGAADAIIVPAGVGPQVFVREGADRSYREIVELMAQGVTVCDAEGRVLRANASLAALIGRPSDQVVGRPVAELVAPESAGELEALVAAARAGGDRSESGVLRLVGPGGAALRALVGVSNLDLDGIDGFLVTLTDLSHQQRDDELVASERLARSIIDQAVDAIVVCDPDGRVLRASREAIRLCGGNPLLRRLDEALPLRLAVPGELADRAGAGDDRAGEDDGDDRPSGPPVPLDELLGDEPIRNLEVALACDDRRAVLLLNSGPVRDESGRRLAQVVTLTDVTPLKQAEARLLEADRRKDEFLAMLAHELRNPLAAMSYGIALLGDAADDADDADADADGQIRAILARQVKHMGGLVDDLLDVARVERGRIVLRLEPVDLAEMAEQAARVVRPAVADRGHELTVEVAPRPLWVLADLTRIEQVVVNLLSNAAKYTPPGGRIRLDARPDPANEGRVALAVRDDGVGLSAEMRERVFELFSQADASLDRQQGGLGIGLTLVRRLVELHGGTIEAASDGPGRGSTFTVRLPAAAPPGPDDRAGGREDPARGRPRRILLVDDNRDMALTLRKLLEAQGHEVDIAHDGPSGLEAAGLLRPEVAILDLGLPGLDGFELSRRFRGLPGTAGCLLIALSGYGGRRDRERAIAAGFDHHLTKPVDPADLDRLIRGEPAPPTPPQARDQAPGKIADGGPDRRVPVPAPTTTGPLPSYRILLVEDQKALAAIAARVLQRVGHVVEVAADGPTALELARRFRPDVILCDLQLDGPMDGHDVARALRLEPELADAPLIAVTAREGDTVQARSLAAGFDLHLTKPVDFTEVHRYVEQARRR